jgi:predicted RNA-binding Zn-ribbon protein involved in translation (DUF1610 family)
MEEREIMHCRNCGEVIIIEDDEDLEICPHCGRDPFIILDEE